MDPTLWLTFSAASLALVLIPGPTVLLVLAYAIGQGRRVAVPTALGVATGDIVAMTASVAGLGALVLASATLFTLIKRICAAYLVWLGLRMIVGASETAFDLETSVGHITPCQAYLNAAAVTALNPKSIVFFIAFVPQFIEQARPLAGQAAILIATFVTLAWLNAIAYALLAERMRLAVRRPNVIAWLTRAGGGALITMGIATASVRRSVA